MADNRAFPLDPRYAPGAEQARQDASVGIMVAMTLIGMVFVGLRVYTRAYIVRNMGMEDWTMLAAATTTLVFLLLFIVSAEKYKVGFSIMSVTLDQIVQSTKLGLAIIVFYKGTVTLIKISILMIYLRIAVSRTFSLLCKGSIALLATYQVIVMIIVPAECAPLKKAWDFSVEGHCINTAVFYNITSGFHILMDIWILLLPYKLILSIPRPLRERISVYAVFGLGIFGTICAMIRFHFLVVVNNSTDPFYDALPINTWSIIEINVGIVCATMPTLRPLFSVSQRNRTKQALNNSDERKLERTASKRSGLPQAKEMFITITAGTVKETPKTRNTALSLQEEFDRLPDRPPPVPPKDVKSPIIASPEMAHQNV
ncbi:hypothetical protein P280DRAFT_424408 [Massarina eburnea CBS 473.64]|uniref:Rhodopsin domain-containing protein n=1 Tax=Massarina eburnea CBS 473.64 TaxID=1395130 RepID=A0A6A6S224_9PLEO|nr:hypothetical protein P280DRAFT_424408 [Massarina eburnea CBS 473.64]